MLIFQAGNYLGDGGVFVPELKTWFGVGSFTETMAQTVEAWDFSDIMHPKMVWRSEPVELVDTRSYYESGRFHIGSNDFTESCFDAKTGKLLWQINMKGFTSYYGCGASGKIFRGSVNNYLWALDPTTGKILWEFRTGGYGSFTGGMAAAYHKVYMLNADGYLYAIDSGTGKQVWKHRAFEPNATQPVLMHYPQFGAITDHKIYWLIADRQTYPPITGLSAFICVDADTGKEIWHSYKAEIKCPAVANGRLYGSDFIYDRSTFTSDPKISGKIGAYMWCFGKGPTSLKIGTDTRDLYGLHYIDQGGETSIIGNATDLSPANLGAPAENMPVKLSWRLPDGAKGEIGTIYTDETGKLFCKWTPPSSGTYMIIAESAGNDAYEAPPISSTTLTVNPASALPTIQKASTAIILIAIVLLIIYIRRRMTE